MRRAVVIFLVIDSARLVTLTAVQHQRIVVVGGGVGGLVTAGLLAGESREITLLEKGDQLGGRMQSETVASPNDAAHEYRFDTGPSLALMPGIYKQTFEALGGIGALSDHVELLEVADPQYRVWFRDEEGYSSTPVDISRDDAKMQVSFETLVPGEGADLMRKYKTYLQLASAFLSFGFDAVIAERPNFNTLPTFLLACLRAWPLQSHLSMLRAIFGSGARYSKVHALLSFQDLYIGLAPAETPAVFSLLQALEYEKGIFYPRGGFGRVARGLATLAERRGVVLRLGAECSEVVLGAAGDATSVRVRVREGEGEGESGRQKDETLPCDAVVVNVDTPRGEELFFPPDLRDTIAVQARPSCGIVSLSFALNITLSSLAHHSLLLGADLDESWRCVALPDASEFDPERFNFYVHAPSRTDPSACPLGHDAITVLVPVPPLPLVMDDATPGGHARLAAAEAALVERVESAVLRRLEEMCGLAPTSLRRHVVAQLTRSPLSWRRDLGLHRGQAFGLAHSLGQLSLLRPRLRHPSVGNVYRVGASTRPGNGVPLVMEGGRLTAEAVERGLLQGRGG